MSLLADHRARPLAPRFFHAPADRVAPLLLGQWLLRRTPDGWVGGLIVEVEAYLVGDPAAHGFRGRTARNASMFGPPGHAYVYQTRHHFCMNAVCQPEGCPEGVLIRALEPIFGLDWMRRQRSADDTRLTRGPACVCAALSIDRSLDGAILTSPTSDLIIAAGPDRRSVLRRLGPVVATPRIGISRAIECPLRFCLSASSHLSRPVSRRTRPEGLRGG